MQKSIYCQTEGKNIFNLSKNPYFNKPHLSKAMSGFKQKYTQFPTSFSGTVFHALSHGLIRFVWSVSLSISRIYRSEFLVSVSSRSRKIILQKSRSRLGLGKTILQNSRSRLSLGKAFYRILGLASVSKK